MTKEEQGREINQDAVNAGRGISAAHYWCLRKILQTRYAKLDLPRPKSVKRIDVLQSLLTGKMLSGKAKGRKSRRWSPGGETCKSRLSKQAQRFLGFLEFVFKTPEETGHRIECQCSRRAGIRTRTGATTHRRLPSERLAVWQEGVGKLRLPIAVGVHELQCVL